MDWNDFKTDDLVKALFVGALKDTRSQTGVVKSDIEEPIENDVLARGDEGFCNQVAAELLLPAKLLLKMFPKSRSREKALDELGGDTLTKYFRRNGYAV